MTMSSCASMASDDLLTLFWRGDGVLEGDALECRGLLDFALRVTSACLWVSADSRVSAEWTSRAVTVTKYNHNITIQLVSILMSINMRPKQYELDLLYTIRSYFIFDKSEFRFQSWLDILWHVLGRVGKRSLSHVIHKYRYPELQSKCSKSMSDGAVMLCYQHPSSLRQIWVWVLRIVKLQTPSSSASVENHLNVYLQVYLSFYHTYGVDG